MSVVKFSGNDVFYQFQPDETFHSLGDVTVWAYLAGTEEPGELTRFILDYIADETPPPTTAVPARLTSSTDSAACKCMFAIS